MPRDYDPESNIEPVTDHGSRRWNRMGAGILREYMMMIMMMMMMMKRRRRRRRRRR